MVSKEFKKTDINFCFKDSSMGDYISSSINHDGEVKFDVTVSYCGLMNIIRLMSPEQQKYLIRAIDKEKRQ